MVMIDTAQGYREYAAAAQDSAFITAKDGTKVKAPCCHVLLVNPALVVANTYNPNHVSKEKMQLLRQSILDNGFCFPIVTIWDGDDEHFVIIDGFHRRLIGGADWFDFDYIPVVVLDHDITKRMTATIQFNKARGVHQVDLDADVIRALIEQGLKDEDVAERLQIDLDTVHRYKQITGVAELFKNSDYSMAWVMEDEEDEEDE